MFQTIGEKVMVAGVYKQGHFIPRKFLWKNTSYQITQITLVTELRDGQTKCRMYSVLSGKNLYRLVFDRDQELWILAEVWMEG